MIANPTSTGWEIIYHRAHALLAAQIAGQWRKKDSPARLYETIAAISHHDDLEREWEKDSLTEAGTPKDFTLEQTNGNYKPLYRHIESALYRGRWVALLTSMHLFKLTKGEKGKNEEADRFLDYQLTLQQQWRKELAITEQEAHRAYAFFQWCDRLSLILCQQKLPADERLLEISKAHDGQRYDIKQLNNGLVTVMPWCFENERFNVNVECSSLSQAAFDDNASLVDALAHAPRYLKDWTFVKPETDEANS